MIIYGEMKRTREEAVVVISGYYYPIIRFEVYRKTTKVFSGDSQVSGQTSNV
jgi:hypothetical protein